MQLRPDFDAASRPPSAAIGSTSAELRRCGSARLQLGALLTAADFAGALPLYPRQLTQWCSAAKRRCVPTAEECSAANYLLFASDLATSRIQTAVRRHRALRVGWSWPVSNRFTGSSEQPGLRLHSTSPQLRSARHLPRTPSAVASRNNQPSLVQARCCRTLSEMVKSLAVHRAPAIGTGIGDDHSAFLPTN